MKVNDAIQNGVVKRRSIGPDGKLAGKYDNNPMLNSLVYEVEFPDGAMREYAANSISENIFSQVDDDVFSSPLMEGIIDYKKDPSVAIGIEEKHLFNRQQQKRLRNTTKGWKLLVGWKDKSETWVPLNVLKEANPVEVSDFAVA